MKFLKLVLILISIILLSSCVRYKIEKSTRNFASHYRPSINLENAANILVNPLHYNSCTSKSVTDMDLSAKEMAENGYLLVGETLFAKDRYPIRAANNHCGDIGAEIVLFNSQIISSASKSMTVLTPQVSFATTTYQGQVGNYIGSSTTTFTQYVPQNINWHVNTYRNWATYWVRGKPPILGAYYGELSDEKKYEAETNSGAYVYLIVSDSPAFYNDLLVGDVITKIDGQKIIKPNDITEILKEKAGRGIVLNIVRKGEAREIRLKLNPAY